MSRYTCATKYRYAQSAGEVLLIIASAYLFISVMYLSPEYSFCAAIMALGNIWR